LKRSVWYAGRFEDQFIETRRAALERCLGKMANHPVLGLDPDLRLFLESDTFAVDVRSLDSFIMVLLVLTV
jgi:sorting nexin-1/2